MSGVADSRRAPSSSPLIPGISGVELLPTTNNPLAQNARLRAASRHKQSVSFQRQSSFAQSTAMTGGSFIRGPSGGREFGRRPGPAQVEAKEGCFAQGSSSSPKDGSAFGLRPVEAAAEQDSFQGSAASASPAQKPATRRASAIARKLSTTASPEAATRSLSANPQRPSGAYLSSSPSFRRGKPVAEPYNPGAPGQPPARRGLPQSSTSRSMPLKLIGESPPKTGSLLRSRNSSDKSRFSTDSNNRTRDIPARKMSLALHKVNIDSFCARIFTLIAFFLLGVSIVNLYEPNTTSQTQAALLEPIHALVEAVSSRADAWGVLDELVEVLNTPPVSDFLMLPASGIQIRQMRMGPDSCKSRLAFLNTTDGACYESYVDKRCDSDTSAMGRVDYKCYSETPFGAGNETWEFRTNLSAVSGYGRAGFVTYLPGGALGAANLNVSRGVLADLLRAGWLDVSTRAVAIRLILYNAHTRLATTMTCLMELHTTGAVKGTCHKRSMLVRFGYQDIYAATEETLARIVSEILFLLFLVKFIFKWILKLKWNYAARLRDTDNWLELSCLLFFVAAVSLMVNIQTSNFVSEMGGQSPRGRGGGVVGGACDIILEYTTNARRPALTNIRTHEHTHTLTLPVQALTTNSYSNSYSSFVAVGVYHVRRPMEKRTRGSRPLLIAPKSPLLP